MTNKIGLFYLNQLFREVKRGEFHASNKLDPGDYPLISCSATDNGIEGHFDLLESKLSENSITISCDGHPLTAFYHNYKFGAKDNVVVCVPNEDMSLSLIFYILTQINKLSWRFSYGRKCYVTKMKKVQIPVPIKDNGEIDTDYIQNTFEVDLKSLLPEKNSPDEIIDETPTFKPFILKSLFDIKSGDFHVAGDIDQGMIPLISCGESQNGLMGFFDIPEDNYYHNTITIAYNGKPLTTKFHPYRFGTKDDVAVCVNSKLKITSLIFIASILNTQTWRFSYGRKCYREKVKYQQLFLPIDSEGNLNEEYMEKTIKNTPYWHYLENQIPVT